MKIVLVGPGRAGSAVALAAVAAGHEIVAVAARNARAARTAADHLAAGAALDIGEGLPQTDLVVVAVKDDAIDIVAAAVAGSVTNAAAAVHLSGAASVSTLAPLAAVGLETGAFHPLQTLPTPEAGAERLTGAWIAVTAEEPLRGLLHDFAGSLGARPFDLADDLRVVYHAAAAAASNFPLVALTMASDLFRVAGVPFGAARPLVEAVVANAFELGPREALTGPVARADVGTVVRQLEAVVSAAPEWAETFRTLVRETAAVAGTAGDFEALE